MPESTKALLADTANHSLARNTWSTYKTAIKHLQSCMVEMGKPLVLPMSTNDVLAFTSWLLVRRNVRGATVDAYLSALRQVHLINGVEPPNLRPDLVKAVVQGAKHMNYVGDRLEGRPSRLPVTITVLKLIKTEVAAMPCTMQMKRLYWAVCSLNFFGGFRVHETLNRFEGHFDPAFCLLGRDIEIKPVTIDGKKEEVLQLKLKSPKEDRVGSACTFVDVYATGGLLCPVRAFRKWRMTNPPFDPDLPAFRDTAGVPLTGRKLNCVLRSCLEKHNLYENGTITSHSFRSGIASLMGSLGFSDEEIMAIGRWSSSAFERYLKVPRTKRAAMARRIGGLGI